MGLDISFNAFHGAYSAFNSFRKCIAWCIGGSYPPHFQEDENGWVKEPETDLYKTDEALDDEHFYYSDEFDKSKNQGICELLAHSDCDGKINSSICKKLAIELENILPKIQEYENKFGSFGHIERDGGYVAITQRFINGCRKAIESKKPLEFY